MTTHKIDFFDGLLGHRFYLSPGHVSTIFSLQHAPLARCEQNFSVAPRRFL